MTANWICRRVGWLAVAIMAVGIGWAAGRVGGRHPAAAADARTAAPDRPPSSRASHGESLYTIYCASCHGPEGRGDGPSAAGLLRPPRDFALRPWRFPVTPESIRTVIRDGVPGTSMPANQAALSATDIDELAALVMRLAEPRPGGGVYTHDADERLQAAGFSSLHGRQPPPLTLVDAAGNEVRLSDFAGRVVLVHFWGLNCTHCLKELSPLRALAARTAAGRVVVLHVCVDAEDAVEAQAAADRVEPGLRVFIEGTGLGRAAFDAQTLPTTWLIGADGRAIGRAVGARDWTGAAVIKLLDQFSARARAEAR